MSTIRLFYRRDSAQMKRRLEDALRIDKVVSTLLIRETVLEDDVLDAIVILISGGKVETVQLDDCGASMNKAAISMARALGSCKHVKLSEPTFLSTFFLEAFLTSATDLETVRIQDRLLEPQVESLAKGLKINKTLHTLDLSRSRIENFSILGEGLKENKCLVCIKLRSVGLHDEELENLLSSLESHPKVDILDVSFNHVRNFSCVGRLLRRPDSPLRELWIGYQNLWQMPRTDISSVVKALKHNKTLSVLGLAGIKLSDQDAYSLGTALLYNSTLELLDVRENNLHDKGIVSLANVAKQSEGLRKLCILKNPFGTNGSMALLDAARENHRLISIDTCINDRIHEQILYYTVLNRCGRGLLFERPTPPLALWPLAMERANKIDWDELNCLRNMKGQRKGWMGDPRIDVLYHFLQESPVLFDGMICSK